MHKHLACLILGGAAILHGQAKEPGIPVTDPLVIAKCGGTCHTRDQQGNLERTSWLRTTPEGWQNVMKRMVLEQGLSVTPLEARQIVKDLSDFHGLAPAEAAAVRYSQERRVVEESNIPNEQLRDACAKCHTFAVALSSKRSAAEWKKFMDSHAARQKFSPNAEAVAYLTKAAPLHSKEWTAWSGRSGAADLTGRWLVIASLPGHGKYSGELKVDRAAADGEYTTRAVFNSVAGDSILVRSGRAVVYGETAWRGRSTGGGTATGDPLNEAREVMTIASDHATADGRWFWGQYYEFGFDVHLQRAPSEGAALLGFDRASLKAGSHGNRLRAIGYNFSADVSPADWDLGPGVTVRSIVSRTSHEIVAEVDVASDARLGTRSATVSGSVLDEAIAIYDRVDYIKVKPDSSVATFGDPTHPKGFLQFEAIGYQRGPDGKMHTADDVALGPVEVTWSLEVFHGAEKAARAGAISPGGLFEPAAASTGNSFDVWVSATAKNETNQKGAPLVGKSYLVVTLPTYTFNGRRYVRDFDRWVDDGPAK